MLVISKPEIPPSAIVVQKRSARAATVHSMRAATGLSIVNDSQDGFAGGLDGLDAANGSLESSTPGTRSSRELIDS